MSSRLLNKMFVWLWGKKTKKIQPYQVLLHEKKSADRKCSYSYNTFLVTHAFQHTHTHRPTNTHTRTVVEKKWCEFETINQSAIRSLWKFSPGRAVSVSLHIGGCVCVCVFKANTMRLCASWDPNNNKQKCFLFFSSFSFFHHNCRIRHQRYVWCF